MAIVTAMTRRSRLAAMLVAASLLYGCVAAHLAGPTDLRAVSTTSLAGPQGVVDAAGRQLWLIPSSQLGLMLRAYLFKPAGNGPFPLAVVNHGSQQDASARAHMGMPAFPALTQWLLERGYAVLLPQRPGHGATGGPYLENQGGCDDADYIRSGDATADSITAAIDYMIAQGFIRKTGVVVIGHSAGGWGALALAARNPPAVSAIVDFAGGRGGHNRNQPNQNCAPDRLVVAAGAFGRTARVPSLWLYAENDSYFAPVLSQRMADAFRSAGGNAVFDLLPATGREGHGLIDDAAPAASWVTSMASFLDAIK
jgi:dienelactone hydrolase